MVRWNRPPSPRVRLFCLPHAGGGAASYRQWGRYLPPDVEVIAFRLPGRETSYREPALTSIEPIVSTIVQEATPLLDLPHVWFGHSMGSLLAFEVCRALRDLGPSEPAALLVSGRNAPHIPPHHPPVHKAARSDLLARLRSLGGTPKALLDDPSVLPLLLPPLRADFTVVESYEHRTGSPLEYPITVYNGTEDRETTPGGLAAWRDHTKSDCVVRSFPGGHFFLHDRPGEVLAALGRDLHSSIRTDTTERGTSK
ncbi:thioesterase II family protein [Nocardiopsis alba]|uniref:thioesterase II family protein n=1 Tax=Nocardiopsis alba TaxID=53437 RepID=UPI0033F26216